VNLLFIIFSKQPPKTMRQIIKRIIRSINRLRIGSFQESQLVDEKRCRISPTVIRQGMRTRFDNPVDGRIYLEIGDDCIVGSTFVFESNDGYVKVGNHCYLGGSTFISHCGIEVGNNVTIAWGCTIYDHNSHSINYLDRRKDIDDQLDDMRNGRNFIKNKDWQTVKTAPIKICDDAWIGLNCIILKGVTIGEGAIVSAGSVVTKDVPSWSVVGGNPAMVLKKYDRP